MTSICNTIDGPEICTVLTPDDCCPPSICNLDLVSFICSFFAYLPKGPLWDYWKRLKVEQLRLGSSVTTESTENANCLTIIDHAAYTAENLFYILRNPLQTVIFESDPITAFYSRSKWLANYGWMDCFSGPAVNVALGLPNPYQVVCSDIQLCVADGNFNQMPGNNTLFLSNPLIDIEALVKAACPPDLKAAVEHALLIALKRAELNPVKTLAVMNFILEPLKVSLEIDVNPEDLDTCAPIMMFDGNQMPGTVPCVPYRPKISITLNTTSGCIETGVGITIPLTCDNLNNPLTQIPISYHFDGFVMPVGTVCAGEIRGAANICPAMMVAECLLMAMLPLNIRYQIFRNDCPDPSDECVVTPPPPPNTSNWIDSSITDDGSLCIITDGTSVYLTQNSGADFFPIYTTGHNIIAVSTSRDPAGNHLAFATDGGGTGGMIFVSSDLGVTWTEIEAVTPGTKVWSDVVVFDDGDTDYFLYASERDTQHTWRYSFGSDSWIDLGTGPGVYPAKIFSANFGSNVMGATFTDVILFSHDGANTWTTPSEDLTYVSTYGDMNFDGSLSFYIGNNARWLYRTQNTGVDWDKINDVGFDVLTGSCDGSGLKIYLSEGIFSAPAPGTIRFSSDQGTSFSITNFPAKTGYLPVCDRNIGTTVIATTTGEGIFYSLDGGATVATSVIH